MLFARLFILNVIAAALYLCIVFQYSRVYWHLRLRSEHAHYFVYEFVNDSPVAVLQNYQMF